MGTEELSPLHALPYTKWRRLKRTGVFSPFDDQGVLFKGTVQRDFLPPLIFHSSNQPGPLTIGLKYFRIWKFSASYLNFFGYITGLSQSPRSIILRGVQPFLRFLKTFTQAFKETLSQK